MKIINSIAEEFLGEIAKEVPIPRHHVVRKEKKGFTLFFNESMKHYCLDSISYKFFKEIDGKKNCMQIAKSISDSTKIPYLVSCKLLPRFINSFSSMKMISSKNTGDKKIKSKQLKGFIPTAPNQIAILLTNQCNLRCSHCGNENRDRKENELTKEEWFRIIDECAKIGVFIFNASGGEPFIRKDWYEILSYARSKNIEVGITSNSTLINEDIVKKLKELKIFNIHLSLDGVGKIHDHFRNQEGVFNKVENAISLLKKYKVPFGITSAISKRNFKDLNNLAEFVRKNNITSWEMYCAIPLGCMDKKEALEPKEILEFAKKVYDFKKNLKDVDIFVGDNLGYFDKYDTQKDWQGCRAGLSICSIDSEGNVKGCPIHPNCLIQGNVRNKSLYEIWNDKNSFGYNRNAKPKLKKQCGKCKFSKICRGGCKASMYSQHKTFEYNNCCLRFIEESVQKERI